MAIKPLPRTIRYMERDGNTKKLGKVEKEVWVTEDYDFGTFRKLIQEIRFNGRKDTILRLGYYVKNKGAPDSKYGWGSQTMFMITKKHFHELLKKAKEEEIIDFSL